MENAEPTVVVTLAQDGEYTVAFAALCATRGAIPFLEGKGTSRKADKALAYALEDLAFQLRLRA